MDGNKHGKGVLYAKDKKNQNTIFELTANYKMGIKDGPYHLMDIRDKNNQYEESGTYLDGLKHGEIIV